MRSARIALVSALAASSLLIGSPAQARHYCGLEDPTANAICESHVTDLPLFQKLICLISKSC
ncbi:MAG TPA: hypothetical protein VHI71_08950 [Actinomycetota bacterium]|nr:hypothetical protein [Actinomycetota bacterium]